MSHVQLLPALMPPVSYATTGNVEAELAADGLALDRVTVDAAQPLRGLTPFAAQEWLADYELVYGLPDPCARPGMSHQ